MKIFKKLLYFLTPKERKRASLLLAMIMIMALLDMAGVASIMPFMAVLTNPGLIETNYVLINMFQIAKIFGVVTNEQFLFVLGVLVFVLLVISLIFKALTNYVELRFITMREYSIGKRLIEGYLNQPYSWFLNRNSTDLGKNILSEVNTIIGNGIAPMITVISNSTLVIAIMILLILIDPKLALISFSILGISYGLIYKLTRGMLSQIGQKRFNSNQSRFSAVSEAFGAAKEVKIGGLEKIYVQRFAEPAKNYSSYQSLAGVIGQLPRYALESIAFGGMLLVTLYLLSKSGTFSNVLPIIALYAFASYRLIPALQQSYFSLTKLRFIGPALDSLHDDLMNLQSVTTHEDKNVFLIKKDITLNHIFYNYPKVSKTVLKNIDLKIPVRSTIGLVGTTGSGKTTTVDIILGLLEAQKGTLKVDDQVINQQNRRAWQRSIGYVPQQIYLSDDTVASNIAFGVNPNEISHKAVVRAAKVANLHKFVVNELPQEYQTKVGERGVRLSGGQRQRIGIARALYHNPQVLILDEATSALDNLTEKAVMEAVYNISNDITIILIAHRLSTVKKCDIIFLLEKGELKDQGTFEELIKKNDNFRKTAIEQ